MYDSPPLFPSAERIISNGSITPMGPHPCTYDGGVMSTTTEEANHDGNDDVHSDPVRREPGGPPRRQPERGELQAIEDSSAGRDVEGVGVSWSQPVLGDEDGGPLAGIQSAFHLTQAYSGPLPTPNDFDAFERTQPGAADRILTMAENRQAAEIENQRLTTRAEARAFLGSAWAVAFLPWGLLVATVTLGIYGQPVAATLTGVATAVSAGPQIIAASRSNKSNS